MTGTNLTRLRRGLAAVAAGTASAGEVAAAPGSGVARGEVSRPASRLRSHVGLGAVAGRPRLDAIVRVVEA